MKISATTLTMLGGLLLAWRPAPQVTVMPGSVMEGTRVLTDKGCLQCHAVNGRGGNRAPDFARSSMKSRTPALFATEMWNHSPKMWAEFESQGKQVPALGSAEVADLFAYFYSSLYFSPQGSAARGRSVFVEKQCVSCHSEVLDPRSQRSILVKWTERRDPIAWAEQMWDHSNEMDAAATNRGIAWPKLSEQDIVDLLMFVAKLPDDQTEMASFTVGEPGLGRTVFERNCEGCHSFGSYGTKVDLLARQRPLSITGYIAAMWNHAPDMRRRSGATAKLNAGEMPDLIAYLFAQRYFLERGSVLKGRKVFDEKGCAKCHEARRKETGAPDLAQVNEVFSPITLTSAVWRHGPSMMEKMKEQKIPWPEFNGSEMADLITYLNSKLMPRIAGQ